MKPGENKGATINGGTFNTDEVLTINIPPKTKVEKDVLKEGQEQEELMVIEAYSCYVYKDEKGKVVKRTTEDGKVLTSAETKKEEIDSER